MENEFQYTYSAEEQEELKRIRERYTTGTESKIDRIRRLDASTTQTAQIVSLIFGVVGTLILGLGMSLIMTDFGSFLQNQVMPIGVLIGVLGGILTGLAYPIYQWILKTKRKKLAPEILRLTDELMKR